MSLQEEFEAAAKRLEANASISDSLSNEKKLEIYSRKPILSLSTSSSLEQRVETKASTTKELN